MDNFFHRAKKVIVEMADVLVRYWVLLVAVGYFGLVIKQYVRAASLGILGFSVPMNYALQTSVGSVITFCFSALAMLFFCIAIVLLSRRFSAVEKVIRILGYSLVTVSAATVIIVMLTGADFRVSLFVVCVIAVPVYTYLTYGAIRKKVKDSVPKKQPSRFRLLVAGVIGFLAFAYGLV